MQIIRDFNQTPDAFKGAVVALGNFDGVHVGHKEIIDQCVASARSYHVAATVMTFEPHPREFFSKQHQKLRLCSFCQKIALMEGLGIDGVFIVRFDQKFASLTAENFVEDVLHKQLRVKQVVTGHNFAFGQNRMGTTQYLAQRAREFGFGYTACPPVASNDAVISSSAIRHLLSEGKVEQAIKLLGHPYIIEGVVRHGLRLGAKLGYPTANLSLNRLFKPRYGVYAVRIWVDGVVHKGVASIGVRPTIGESEPLLEVHVFDMAQDMYGKRVQVECVSFIRDEVKFDSLEALKDEIARDCRKARALLVEG